MNTEPSREYVLTRYKKHLAELPPKGRTGFCDGYRMALEWAIGTMEGDPQYGVPSYEKTLTEAQYHAEIHGFAITPDTKHRDAVITGLTKNHENYGLPYCPCKIRSGDDTRDKHLVCPCASHQDDIRELGHCKCKLFVRRS